jgi:hypothetical protein
MINIKKLSAKLGTDGFSLVLGGTKVTDSKVVCKHSNERKVSSLLLQGENI